LKTQTSKLHKDFLIAIHIKIQKFFATIGENNVMIPIDILLLSAGGVSSLVIMTFAYIARNNKKMENNTNTKSSTQNLTNTTRFWGGSREQYSTTMQESSENQFLDELFEEYQDHEYVGKGGFSKVFKATKKDGSIVALKIPLAFDRKSGKTFLNEISVWRELNHPNIIKVFDLNIAPIPHIETEFVDGGTLENIPKPMTIENASSIILKIVRAIEYAHSEGRSHRDLKPKNILLTTEEEPKITDWGLSKITAMSVSIGMEDYTLLYAAPEQIDFTLGKSGEKTDVYQIGLIFYELLTGKIPFEADSKTELMSKIIRDEVKKPSQIIPEAEVFDEIIVKSLSKETGLRPTITELKQELIKVMKGSYEDSFQTSKSTGNSQQAFHYCSELAMLYAKDNKPIESVKYFGDIKHYTHKKHKKELDELANKLDYCAKNNTRIDEDTIKKMDLTIHRARISGLTAK